VSEKGKERGGFPYEDQEEKPGATKRTRNMGEKKRKKPLILLNRIKYGRKGARFAYDPRGPVPSSRGKKGKFALTRGPNKVPGKGVVSG